MSGIDLEKQIGAEVREELPENEFIEDIEQEESENRGISLPSIDFSWLRTPTGDGTIEERLEHPLNYSKSRGVAQIIRGAEGFFGSLNLAIVDIVLGILEVMKEKRQGGRAVA
ncbi:hypothetical protein LPY66_11360 [Dehalobacter sp. DCM]|uniref:hypothetical protein n=1 Tax=Dehalobacter sp. DCM TaxID=2907827 RepID=UPI003081AD84|nr:hypothetical protein LPY66_11360 [Dehalobacter sp. DCM]